MSCITIPPAALRVPVLELWNGITVVRDDLVPGGSKRRMLDNYLVECRHPEYVYASPAQGYAQLALAYACQHYGRQAIIFTAKRQQLHPLTQKAKDLGAKIMMVPTGYLSNVQAKARAYCEMTGAHYLPFGLESPKLMAGLAWMAGQMREPKEVWTAAGSGVLTRALQMAWPHADFYAVQVGKEPNVGRAKIIKAPEKFEQDAEFPPPFPSCSNYDAKVWRFLRDLPSGRAEGALFWNVGS